MGLFLQRIGWYVTIQEYNGAAFLVFGTPPFLYSKFLKYYYAAFFFNKATRAVIFVRLSFDVSSRSSLSMSSSSSSSTAPSISFSRNNSGASLFAVAHKHTSSTLHSLAFSSTRGTAAAPHERQNRSVPLLGALVSHCRHCLAAIPTLVRPAPGANDPDGCGCG